MHANNFILVTTCLVFMLSCQNKKAQIQQVNIKDSTNINQIDTTHVLLKEYNDCDCDIKLCKIIENRIKTVISEDRYKYVTNQNRIIIRISYTLKGKIVSVDFKRIGFTAREFKLIEKAIMQEELGFACYISSDIYELNTKVSPNDTVTMYLSIPYNSEHR